MTHSSLTLLPEMTRRALAEALAAAKRSGTPVFAVDATAGNGHDTLFLAREVGETGRVFAFDVQESALAATKKRLEEAGEGLAGRVAFIRAGHETARDVLPPEAANALWAATFNLGFLPGSDKSVVTAAPTTIAALEALAGLAAPGCVISVHTYRGHKGGEAEHRAVTDWLRNLPWEAWRVAEYAFANKVKNGESLFLLEKT